MINKMSNFCQVEQGEKETNSIMTEGDDVIAKGQSENMSNSLPINSITCTKGTNSLEDTAKTHSRRNRKSVYPYNY